MDTQIRDTLLAVKNAVNDPTQWAQGSYARGERRCVLGWADALTARAPYLRAPLYGALDQAARAHVAVHQCSPTRWGTSIVAVNDICGHAGVMDVLDRALLATAPVLPATEPMRETVAV